MDSIKHRTYIISVQRYIYVCVCIYIYIYIYIYICMCETVEMSSWENYFLVVAESGGGGSVPMS